MPARTHPRLSDPLSSAGPVVLVLDTLRADFLALARRHAVELPAFERLFELLPHGARAVCGSFPTGPMRTDLLTGRLSFLDGRWDRPRPSDALWPPAAGLRSVHVGDNYMLWTPSLGGSFRELFDETVAVRGTGADPWVPVRGEADLPSVRRARLTELEAQFLANAARGAGGAMQRGTGAVFEPALARLGEEREGELLWIECFRAHEPWTDAPEGARPGYPPYGRVGSAVSADAVGAYERSYALRLVEIDRALDPLVDALRASRRPVFLWSDHGFYFGEYGLFGKPKGAPLLPPVSELLFRTNVEVEAHLPPGPFQPHLFPRLLAECGLIDAPCAWHPDCDLAWGSTWKVQGRNTPAAPYVQVLVPEGLCLIGRGGRPSRFAAWSELATGDAPEDLPSGSARDILDRAAGILSSRFAERAWIRELELPAATEVVR